MCEEAIERRAAQRPAQALGGAADRRGSPFRRAPARRGVDLDPVGRRLRRRIGDDSKISTPASSSRSRRPSARRAGCTVAASGKKTPPRKAGERSVRRPARVELLRRVGLAQLAAGGERFEGRVVEGLGGRDLEVAGATEPGVDPLLLAEIADPDDRVLGGAGDGQRPLGRPSACACSAARPRASCRSRRCGRSARARRWPASSRTTRASGSSASACQAAHMPGVAAADHDHVGLALAAQRRQRLDLTGLLQPVAVRRVLHLLQVSPKRPMGGRRLELR